MNSTTVSVRFLYLFENFFSLFWNFYEENLGILYEFQCSEKCSNYSHIWSVTEWKPN